jgi:hypothetical protein
MASLHPLALRILGALGAGGAAVLVAGGATSLATSCCPTPEDTGPHTDTLGAACVVVVPSSFQQLEQQCVTVDAVACPPFDDPSWPALTTEPWVCGPLASPSSSSSASGSGGTGGAGGSSGTGGTGGTGGSGDAGPQVQCCYGIIRPLSPGGCGRPLVVEGCAVTSPAVPRGGWSSAASGAWPEAACLPARIRAELAARWLGDAALEHASVASFARFVLDLLAAGAPADLVRAAQAAMRDEIDHAERCYALGSRHAGRALGPGPLPIAGVTAGGPLADIALRAVIEGCIGETMAAVVARRALEVTTDPEARAALTVIARDEAAHAELAFRFVAWAARDEATLRELRRAVPRALEAAGRSVGEPAVTPDDAALEAHGQPGGLLRAEASREALAEVVGPCLATLLGPRSRDASR